jgi:glucosamine-6-phosphate deaminase
MNKIKPTVVTLALDPEGSGPDTHYKTLIALGEAIDHYVKENPEIDLKIWGYRNVWSRWHLADVNMVVPVSLNAFAVLHNMFDNCFRSQKSASFPSYELEGTFSQLAHKVWVDQHEDLKVILGSDYFYGSDSLMLKRAFGAIYLKEMDYDAFKTRMNPVRALLKAKSELEE